MHLKLIGFFLAIPVLGWILNKKIYIKIGISHFLELQTNDSKTKQDSVVHNR